MLERRLVSLNGKHSTVSNEGSRIDSRHGDIITPNTKRSKSKFSSGDAERCMFKPPLSNKSAKLKSPMEFLIKKRIMRLAIYVHVQKEPQIPCHSRDEEYTIFNLACIRLKVAHSVSCFIDHCRLAVTCTIFDFIHIRIR